MRGKNTGSWIAVAVDTICLDAGNNVKVAQDFPQFLSCSSLSYRKSSVMDS